MHRCDWEVFAKDLQERYTDGGIVEEKQGGICGEVFDVEGGE